MQIRIVVRVERMKSRPSPADFPVRQSMERIFPQAEPHEGQAILDDEFQPVHPRTATWFRRTTVLKRKRP
jgi:hypothetical protein